MIKNSKSRAVGIRLPCPPCYFRRFLDRLLVFSARVQNLDPERPTESPAAVVRLGTVVIHEDPAEAAIAKDRTAELSDLHRCFQPSRRLRVETARSVSCWKDPPLLGEVAEGSSFSAQRGEED